MPHPHARRIAGGSAIVLSAAFLAQAALAGPAVAPGARWLLGRRPAQEASRAPAAPIRVLLWYGEAGDGSRAIDAFSRRGPWRIPPSVSRAKTTFVFDREARFERLELASCDKPFEDGFEAIFGLDLWAATAEGGKATLTLAAPKTGAAPARTLTLLALGKGGACVSAIRAFAGGSELRFSALEEVSSAFSPVDAGAALFDLRGETAAFLRKPIEISWASERRIDRVEIWNGDQASLAAYAAVPRAKALAIEGEGGYRETVALEDKMAPQEIALARPFKGRSLVLRVEEAYGGQADAAALSELRFFDSGHEWVPSAARALARQEASLRALFERALLGRALDRTLAADHDDDRWLARFRSDGTFFIRGFDDDQREARTYVAMGRFEAKAAAVGLDLRLRGFRIPSNIELDGDACGHRCYERAASPANELPFLETVRLEPIPHSAMVLARSAGPRASQALRLDSLKLGLGDLLD